MPVFGHKVVIKKNIDGTVNPMATHIMSLRTIETTAINLSYKYRYTQETKNISYKYRYT